MNGEAVGVVDAGTLYFVLIDHIGRPIFGTDNLGGKVWEATYQPFGGVHTISSLSLSALNLRFPGQW